MRLLQSVHGVGDNVSHDVVRVEAGSPAYHSHAVISVYQGHHGTRGQSGGWQPSIPLARGGFGVSKWNASRAPWHTWLGKTTSP